MANGMSLPPRAPRGRVELDRGSQQLRKIVRQIVRPGDSTNPFLSAGTPSAVFHLNDQVLKAQIETRIKAHFRRLTSERRAALKAMKFSDPSVSTRDMEIRVDYVDLETNRPDSATSKGA